MVSRELRNELCRKMDDVIMALVAVARAEDDISADLSVVARLLTEAKTRLEKTLEKAPGT
jgi:hypothetical protein